MSIYTPKDFAGDTPPPRIMGTETELMLSIRDHSGAEAGALTRLVLQKYGGRYQFLPNGARVYPDCGNVEYATPECLGPLESTLAEMAGQLIIKETLSSVPNFPHKIYNRTGGYDPSGLSQNKSKTNGYHQNFLTRKYASLSEQREDAKIIGAHISSRPVWAGAGVLGLRGYFISQKAQEIGLHKSKDDGNRDTHVLSVGTHGTRTSKGRKPILSWSRKGTGGSMEAHSRDWERLEIRHADAAHSPWVRFMGMATTSLVLRIIEHKDMFDRNTDWEDLKFNNIGFSTRLISRDTSLHVRNRLRSGGISTAVGFQKRLATMALELNENILLPSDEQVAAHEWLRICEDLEKVDVDDEATVDIVRDRIEWAARLATIRRHLGGTAVTELSYKLPEAAKIDIIWDQIFPNTISDKYWQKQQPGFYEKQWSHMHRLKTEAPQGTRASARSHLMRTRPIVSGVHWGHVALDNEEFDILPDPYRPVVLRRTRRRPI